MLRRFQRLRRRCGGRIDHLSESGERTDRRSAFVSVRIATAMQFLACPPTGLRRMSFGCRLATALTLGSDIEQRKGSRLSEHGRRTRVGWHDANDVTGLLQQITPPGATLYGSASGFGIVSCSLLQTFVISLFSQAYVPCLITSVKYRRFNGSDTQGRHPKGGIRRLFAPRVSQRILAQKLRVGTALEQRLKSRKRLREHRLSDERRSPPSEAPLC